MWGSHMISEDTDNWQFHMDEHMEEHMDEDECHEVEE